MKLLIAAILLISNSAFALNDNDSLLLLGKGARFVALNDFEVPANSARLWTCRNSLRATECVISERSIVEWENQCTLEIIASKETRKLMKGTVLEVVQTVKDGNLARVDFDHPVIRKMYCWETEYNRYDNPRYPPKFSKVKELTRDIFQITEKAPTEINAKNICR